MVSYPLSGQPKGKAANRIGHPQGEYYLLVTKMLNSPGGQSLGLVFRIGPKDILVSNLILH
jgi:hypothetical protein